MGEYRILRRVTRRIRGANGRQGDDTKHETRCDRNALAPADEEWNYYYQLGISDRRRQWDQWRLRLIAPLGAAGEATITWARRHWLLLFNSANLLLFLGTFASPLFYHLEWSALAQPAFAVYNILCLQRSTHSFFVWCYQMAMEQRMIATPAAQLVAGLLYAALRSRRFLRPLHAWWFLVGSAPMLVDIFSQSWGWRASDGSWRTVTGVLFGVVTVWLFGPLLDWAWHPTNLTGKVTLRRNGSWHRQATVDPKEGELYRGGILLAD